MKRLAFPLLMLPAILGLVVAWPRGAVREAQAAPAWGGNCMSCHAQVIPSPLVVVNNDTAADPDEGLTGAPDRGTLKVFHGFTGRANRLELRVTGLAAGDTYAVQLKRLRFPGVTQSAELPHFPDCDWPEWGDVPSYYTDPAIAYTAGAGPTQFAYALEVYAGAAYDYFDLVLAVAGKSAADDALFYGEEHVYLQVVRPGDLDLNGAVEVPDFWLLMDVLGSPGVQIPPAGTDLAVFVLADIDDDEDADLGDFAQFQAAFTGE